MSTSTPALPPGQFEGACLLDDWGVVRAAGEDAARFLHGQLSNDFQLLDTAHARLAAYCTAQGRMLASFIGCKRGADEIWLACRADLLPNALRRLSMFVLRAKARLADAREQLAVVGLAGAPAAAWLGDAAGAAAWDKRDRGAACIVRLHEVEGLGRWLWIGPRDEAAELLAALPALDAPAWQLLEVRSGVAPVSQATVEKFVPQMLNYELVGGVDFKKGCYPGQEVVARSQYLGKLKRRAFVLAGDVPMQAGQEVYWSGDAGQPAGQVAAAAPAPGGGWEALAELKIAVVTDGTLHLGSPAGAALRVGTLPYAIPESAGTPAAAS